MSTSSTSPLYQLNKPRPPPLSGSHVPGPLEEARREEHPPSGKNVGPHGRLPVCPVRPLVKPPSLPTRRLRKPSSLPAATPKPTRLRASLCRHGSVDAHKRPLWRHAVPCYPCQGRRSACCVIWASRAVDLPGVPGVPGASASVETGDTQRVGAGGRRRVLARKSDSQTDS